MSNRKATIQFMPNLVHRPVNGLHMVEITQRFCVDSKELEVIKYYFITDGQRRSQKLEATAAHCYLNFTPQSIEWEDDPWFRSTILAQLNFVTPVEEN